MNIRPTKDRVLILPKEKEQKSASGLILVGNKDSNVRYGSVVAVGDDCHYLLPTDKVIYNKGTGTEIEHEGVTFVLMHENEILAEYE